VLDRYDFRVLGLGPDARLVIRRDSSNGWIDVYTECWDGDDWALQRSEATFHGAVASQVARAILDLSHESYCSRCGQPTQQSHHTEYGDLCPACWERAFPVAVRSRPRPRLPSGNR
jgi:hypothetical protein